VLVPPLADTSAPRLGAGGCQCVLLGLCIPETLCARATASSSRAHSGQSRPYSHRAPRLPGVGQPCLGCCVSECRVRAVHQTALRLAGAIQWKAYRKAQHGGAETGSVTGTQSQLWWAVTCRAAQSIQAPKSASCVVSACYPGWICSGLRHAMCTPSGRGHAAGALCGCWHGSSRSRSQQCVEGMPTGCVHHVG
jgi:hypothetical protein